MSIAEAADRLVQTLDEKCEIAVHRREAILSGDCRKVAYIEQYIYPAINQRIIRQVKSVNEEFMKYERGRYDSAKTN